MYYLFFVNWVTWRSPLGGGVYEIYLMTRWSIVLLCFKTLEDFLFSIQTRVVNFCLVITKCLKMLLSSTHFFFLFSHHVIFNCWIKEFKLLVWIIQSRWQEETRNQRCFDSLFQSVEIFSMYEVIQTTFSYKHLVEFDSEQWHLQVWDSHYECPFPVPHRWYQLYHPMGQCGYFSF